MSTFRMYNRTEPMTSVSLRLLIPRFSLGKKGNLNMEQGLTEADILYIYNGILLCHKKE